MSETTGVTKTEGSALPAALTASVNSSDHLPNLKITSGNSNQLAEGKANMGDWYDGSVSLGRTIKFTCLGYRYTGIVFKDNQFEEKIVLAENGIELKDRPEFKKLVEKWGIKAVNHGIDLLVYLPNTKQFLVLVCTSWNLKKISLNLYENAKDGAVVSLKGNIGKTKKGFIDITWDIDFTGEVLENIPELEENLEKYRKEIDAIEDTTESSTSREV